MELDFQTGLPLQEIEMSKKLAIGTEKLSFARINIP
jgi:hypothetical protein